MAKLLHWVRTACILRMQRPGYSPKNTCHLSGSMAKQQSPHENNETAFNLVLHCPYEQPTHTCKVQRCRGMQDAHMFKVGRNQYGYITLPSRGPHSGEKSIWLHQSCLLRVPMVGRLQYTG